MASKFQHCPHCGTVGKVHRSKPRGRIEELLQFIVPVYGVYRCHNCNWRGWLPRGSTSAARRRMLIAVYAAVVLAVLAFATLQVVDHWPKPEFKYPVGGGK